MRDRIPHICDETPLYSSKQTLAEGEDVCFVLDKKQKQNNVQFTHSNEISHKREDQPPVSLIQQD